MTQAAAPDLRDREPETTVELLVAALRATGLSARELARRLRIRDENALNLDRHRGKLTPTHAAAVAKLLNKDADLWFTVAAIEKEPESTLKQEAMKRLLQRVQNS
jgi:plasmid maintenance system antidote protein VapI